MAERRRIALAEALEQNKEYATRISVLEEENQTYKEQLDECRALIDVLKVNFVLFINVFFVFFYHLLKIFLKFIF